MKLKPFNLITVFLATSGLLVPAQVAFGRSLAQTNLEEAQHLVCIKQGQHFLCDVEKSGQHDRVSDSVPAARERQAADKEVKPTQSGESTDTVVPQLLSSTQQETIANILIGFIYLVLPCGLGLGIFLYNKYRVHRAAIIQEQIELLEKLWQYGSDNDATSDTQTRS